MMKLRLKLSLFNLLSKIVFTALFLVFMPYIIERVSLRQVDNDLIQKREKFISLISDIGIEPFITSDSSDAFGSYNILKEEFLSLEKTDQVEDCNFIEVTPRLIEDEEISYRVLNYTFKVDDEKYLLEVGISLESIIRAGKTIRNILLGFLTFIILITFITDVQYTRVLLIPLEKIRKKLKRISDPALFDKTPVITTTSDFCQLDSALRELMEHINTLFQKEKETTVNISHELMTPVSVLRSKLENILILEDTNPSIASKIEESLRTLHRLQSLINSLLLITRIESNQYLRNDTFSVNEVLEEIINELSPIALDGNVVLKKELTNDLLYKGANRSLIFSMLFNIVNNALSNTPSDGQVLINSTSKDGKFRVIISDTGRGMTEAQKSTLFSRFKTKDKESGDGTGIGLAIAKSIADFHKIEVIVTSEKDLGTAFSFFFPINS